MQGKVEEMDRVIKHDMNLKAFLPDIKKRQVQMVQSACLIPLGKRDEPAAVGRPEGSRGSEADSERLEPGVPELSEGEVDIRVGA